MVFLSSPLFVRTAKFWRIQQYLRFSWAYRNRKRNCYTLGIRYIHKALRYSTTWRSLKKIQQTQLFNQRLEAAAAEHGVCHRQMMEGLARTNILLDRKVLTDLAIYEPRTFQSLAAVSCERLDSEGLPSAPPILPVRDLVHEARMRKFSKLYKLRR